MEQISAIGSDFAVIWKKWCLIKMSDDWVQLFLNILFIKAFIKAQPAFYKRNPQKDFGEVKKKYFNN